MIIVIGIPVAFIVGIIWGGVIAFQKAEAENKRYNPRGNGQFRS